MSAVMASGAAAVSVGLAVAVAGGLAVAVSVAGALDVSRGGSVAGLLLLVDVDVPEVMVGSVAAVAFDAMPTTTTDARTAMERVTVLNFAMGIP